MNPEERTRLILASVRYRHRAEKLTAAMQLVPENMTDWQIDLELIKAGIDMGLAIKKMHAMVDAARKR